MRDASVYSFATKRLARVDAERFLHVERDNRAPALWHPYLPPTAGD